MDKLSYKTFVWPQNPHTYKEEYKRVPYYYTADGETYFKEIGDMQRVISGSGVFYGANAFDEFKKLILLFENNEAGNLEHPIWGIRYCYFTGRELTQEPKDNYISYKFEFTTAEANGVVPR